MTLDPALLAALALVALGAGALIGRFTGKGASRIRELEAQIEGARKEQERALAELRASKQEIQRIQQEQERYRGDVAAHFAGTSNLLRELTVQYRAVYDHLSEGARSLCPEGMLELEGDIASGALPLDTGEAASVLDEDPEREGNRSGGDSHHAASGRGERD